MKKYSQGFTIVELLVVVAIIAVLSVIGITIFTGVQKGARDSTRRADVNAIAKAMEANKTSNSNIGTCKPTTKRSVSGKYQSYIRPVNFLHYF